ncbi:tyrosine-type recombinase/integrase [Vibrio parahaemolyticus]|uniref:tyrosine-type recombinase/integrase n=1 Tax=Vibrio parahaemolyticus TaxID=670 RepID=UPI0003F4EA86|nr:tyrosine-type recombinase/integrase [Vibrio parahaemolyticus]EJG0938450.1 tyrosine-type recombinase/integrase [Vibrio parahaemolyticus O1]EGQ7810577.1 tyrosine-type recombinase/integrase [Vibrio parahaemolyticus]EGQ8181046.1 tyrosine-type recombinase/integrase [Vibrio parahaemolyticus]EGR0398518.1 site-specific integrase [Vibrio parahaemolyticus]EGR1757327.1 site-specific integrase [Vibrio parahaemolyticus]
MPVKILENFSRWNHMGLDGKLDMAKPRSIPFVTYGNGVPCYEANMYIHKLMEHGNKDKTLKTYANNIVALVQFVEKAPNIQYFSQLTDSKFRLFIQSLQAERKPNGKRVKSNNRVLDIGIRCIDFLKFVQEFHDLHLFIGADKANAITIKEKTHKINIEGSKNKKEITSWTHSCLPSKDAVKRRLPVGAEDALRVWEFIQNQSNRAVRYRDIALYQLMEQSGGRVTELHLVTVEDFEDARKMSEPSLRMHTLKRKDEQTTRHVPIPKTLITDIGQYLKYRRKILKKKKIKDHDFLFISTTTGDPFKADSWTTYMNNWKKELKIEGELHPHLYRHAFITHKLKEIILQHNEINDADEFRKHLLHTETFKLQLREWTGHTQLHSLESYIHLAFAEINGYKKTYDAAALSSSVSIVKDQLKRVKKQIKEKEVTFTEGMNILEEIIEGFETDIQISIKH